MEDRGSPQPWDVGPARFWAVAILVTVVMPMSLRPTAFEWDLIDMTLGGGGGAMLLSLILPYLLAIAALVAIRVARGVPKARGAVYAGSALLVLLFGFSQLSGMFLLGGQGRGAFRSVLPIVSLFILGPALVAAGSRVQRRENGQTLARMVAGVGGLALVAGFFIPLDRGFLGDVMLVQRFIEPGVWAHAWWANVWLALVLVFGLLGAALLLPSTRPAQERGVAVSRLARLLLIGLAVILLITGWMAPSEFSRWIMLAMVRGSIHLIGTVILLAIGLALLLEERTNEPEVLDHADAF